VSAAATRERAELAAAYGTSLVGLKASATEKRRDLRAIWEQGRELPPIERVALARHLAKIKIRCKTDRDGNLIRDGGGNPIPYERRFELRPKDRRELITDLLMAGVAERRVFALVDVPERTRRRILAEWRAEGRKTRPLRRMNKPRSRPKRDSRVGSAGTRRKTPVRTCPHGACLHGLPRPIGLCGYCVGWRNGR
jgi:hypothetical protein